MFENILLNYFCFIVHPHHVGITISTSFQVVKKKKSVIENLATWPLWFNVKIIANVTWRFFFTLMVMVILMRCECWAFLVASFFMGWQPTVSCVYSHHLFEWLRSAAVECLFIGLYSVMAYRSWRCQRWWPLTECFYKLKPKLSLSDGEREVMINGCQY